MTESFTTRGTPTAANGRLMRLATIASVSTATLLIAAKVVAWLMTGSMSVMASLIDSVMDVAASLINLFAVRYSLLPADNEHRFGHGKAEPLAGLAQAMFIAGSAAFLILHAADRLLHPQPLEDLTVGIVVMLFSMVATLGLLLFQYYVIKKTASTAIRADALHYASDLVTNISILIALGLATYGWQSADGWIAIGIAIYILYSAWRIGYEAFHLLLDHELSAETQAHILAIAQRHPNVLGVHDLRTRQSGQAKFIQLHIELDTNLSFVTAHKIADEIENAIEGLIPDSEVIIHQDPVKMELPPNPILQKF